MTARPRVPDLLVERLALGELPPGAASDVRRRLASEPDGAARLDALARDDAAILGAYPPAEMSARIRARAAAHARPQRRRPWVWPALGALAAAAIVLFVVRPASDPAEGPRGGAPLLEPTRAKGDDAPLIAVFRQGDDEPERLAPGAVAAPGDRLQLGYAARGDRHGVLVSIDGHGAVTLHFPDRVDGDTTLEPDGEALLAYAFELDDAPSFERFILVTAPDPIAPGAVLDAARRLARGPDRGRTGDLEAPVGSRQSAFLVHKAAPR